jgi:phage antirepressor YoqD-like protein
VEKYWERKGVTNMPTILKLELPVEQIKRTETEKEKGQITDKEITLKTDGITVILQGNPGHSLILFWQKKLCLCP